MTPVNERKVWTAKAAAICAYDLCPHNGKIRVGEAIAWNRTQAGVRYHADCFLKVKGVEVTTVSKRSAKAIAVAVPFDVAEVESVIGLKPFVLASEEPIELKHKLYSLLKSYVAKRRYVYLWGAPGAGKSFVCKQIAKELKLDYAYISVNPKSAASLLFGYMDMGGIYRESELYRKYRDGGVFLLDELDNCDSSVLTLLNGMLSGDEGSFPCGMVSRHPNFVFIGAGNTNGRGPTWQFPMRQKIDESNISRLTFIQWDYDTDLELAMGLQEHTKATAWVRWIQSVRNYCGNRNNGVKGGIYADARAIIGIANDLDDLGKTGFSVAEVIERHVFKGSDSDTVARILANVPTPR